jgi:hypothetical protein
VLEAELLQLAGESDLAADDDEAADWPDCAVAMLVAVGELSRLEISWLFALAEAAVAAVPGAGAGSAIEFSAGACELLW